MSINLHLTHEQADALLSAADIEPCVQESGRGNYTSYTLPGQTSRSRGGGFGTDYLWEKDEACYHAIDIVLSVQEALVS